MSSKKGDDRTLYFVIVAKGDVPVYEAHLSAPNPKAQREDLLQFIIHAALDAVDQKIWSTPSLYLKDVDKFNELTISAFATAGNIKFMLLHDQKTDEAGVRQFFNDVYENYLKISLNPFYGKNTPITSRLFDERIKLLGKKLLS